MNKITERLPLIGGVGLLVIVGGLLICAIGYTGPEGEKYSVLNHYISELGYNGISRYDYVFDIALMLSGIFMATFIYGISSLFNKSIAKVLVILGLIAGLFCFLVGVFPMNISDTHQLVTAIFFVSFSLVSLTYIVAVLTQKPSKLSKLTIIPSVTQILSGFLFWYIVFVADNSLTPHEELLVRPDVWLPAIFEWSILISLLLWFLSITINLSYKTKND